ncbi:EF-hand calcium-binding domain-containing protein 10 [Blyttiomyces sp. JEL0837]|nr:EF-hand calcium-binding domain-containing protein 10 [Blyttiomyces sp. JEL0837]
MMMGMEVTPDVQEEQQIKVKELPTLTTKDLMQNTFPEEDHEDADYDPEAEEELDEGEEEHVDDEIIEDDEEHGLEDDELNTLQMEAADILAGRKVLRSGAKVSESQPKVAIFDDANYREEEDLDYNDEESDAEADELDNEEEVDGDEEGDDDDMDDDMDEDMEEHLEEDIEEEEACFYFADLDLISVFVSVKDVVINAAPLGSLPMKDSTFLRDGKEIPSVESVIDLTARLNQPTMQTANTAATTTKNPQSNDATVNDPPIMPKTNGLKSLIASDDPRALMTKKLEEMKASKSRGQSLVIFSRENLIALFRIYDVTGKGYITVDQYLTAMDNVGAQDYNKKPSGSEQGKISVDTFVENA